MLLSKCVRSALYPAFSKRGCEKPIVGKLRCIVLVQERDDQGGTARNSSILLMIPELYPIVTDMFVPGEFSLGIVP